MADEHSQEMLLSYLANCKINKPPPNVACFLVEVVQVDESK
jgi:hypothetical protein